MRAGWMRPSATSRSIVWRDLAAEGIEARQDDGAGRVIHDQLDARRELERADVATLAPDDSALQIVAGQVDHRDGRFDRVLGGAPLDSVGDDLLRAGAGHLARLGLDALDEVGRIAAGFRFDLPEEELFGFVVRQPRDALQLALPLGGELLGAGDGRLGRLLAIPDRPFFAAQLLVEFVGRGDPLGERARLVGERLFEGRDFLPAGADFALGAGGQLVGFFLGLEERFLLLRFRIALRVAEHSEGLLFSATYGFGRDPLAVGYPPREDQPRGEQRDEGH